MQELKVSEVKGWDTKALNAKVSELRREIFDLKMKKVTTGLEKPHQLKVAKKNIARLLTVKNAKGDA